MGHPGKAYEKFKEFLLEKLEKLLIIKINYPRKRNALNRESYIELTNILHTAAADESVVIVAITGVGDFYTSGNDLSQSDDGMDFKERIAQNLVRAFFEFPKLLIAVVNGPCIGIGMTTAALCDVIYCTDTAYFYTPFTKLGLCAEGCSSYTFPKVLGRSKATEMLVLNQKLSAAEALEYKLVSEVVKPEELNTKIWPKILEFTRLPPGALLVGKSLMKRVNHKELEEAMITECEELTKRWHSDEFFNAVMEFSQRKRKSKL